MKVIDSSCNGPARLCSGLRLTPIIFLFQWSYGGKNAF